eukprot:13457407-Ditylum_brightwellii.AAC.1
MVIMAGCSEEKEETEPTVATEATEVTIHNDIEEVARLHIETIELNKCCTMLSTKCTGIASVELFQSEFIKLDGALECCMIAMLICRGIFKDDNQDKESIIP